MHSHLTSGCVKSLGTAMALAFLARTAPGGAAEDLAAYGLEGLPVPKEAVKFVDGVRCGDPNDPHQPVDYDRPSRIDTVLGRPARVAAGPWQVFGYTLAVAQPNAPHLVVITWPDDVGRRVHFRLRPPKTGYNPLRAGLNSLYSAEWKVNSKGWVRSWTPLFIPGGTDRQVAVMLADSRASRGLAPNHQGPKELAPWAVGEIILYEITDPAAVLPPLRIAHPVEPGEQRYFGFTGLGYAEGYLRDPANKDYLKQYLRHVGVNFLRVAGGQGGPPYGQPQFENHLALLDELGVHTSFVFFKYFNAFLMDRIKSKTLPQELIDTMPQPIKDAIDRLDGWSKPNNLYEGGSYDAKLMVMPLNWLDPEMGPWLKKLVQHYLAPAAAHKSVRLVHFFGTGSSERSGARRAEGLSKAVDAFTAAVKGVRNDLVVEVPSMYIDLRARERNNLPVPYGFDYQHPYSIANEKNPAEPIVCDRTRLYEGWPERMTGVVGGLNGSLWRGFHFPPPGLGILDSPQALAAVRRFDDGWVAEFRVCEQNESESPKGIGWINDFYAWTGPAGRVNVLRMMAANPRYVVLNTGHEGPAWQEANLRMLAGVWRAFPWGKTEDLSAALAPPGSKVTVLRCKDRLLLINAENIARTVALPAGAAVDALSGQAIQANNVQLEPFAARTVLVGRR